MGVHFAPKMLFGTLSPKDIIHRLIVAVRYSPLRRKTNAIIIMYIIDAHVVVLVIVILRSNTAHDTI